MNDFPGKKLAGWACVSTPYWRPVICSSSTSSPLAVAAFGRSPALAGGGRADAAVMRPFVAGERRISALHGAVLLAVVALSTLTLTPWLLLIWCGALGAVIRGGCSGRAGASNVSDIFTPSGICWPGDPLGVVPEVAPGSLTSNPCPATFWPFQLPVLLVRSSSSRPISPSARAGDAFDFSTASCSFFSRGFVLGSLAYMLIGRVHYLEAVFRTSLSLAGALLVLAWVWNPGPGGEDQFGLFALCAFPGDASPEQWLIVIKEESEREPTRRFPPRL